MEEKQVKENSLKNQEETEKKYKLALETAPCDADIHFDYGNFLEEMERWEEAEEQYKLALEINPDTDIHYNYGVLLAEMERWKEAEEQYKLALKTDPNNAYIHYNYGVLLAEMERWKEAEEQYKLALEINPNDADIHYNYGVHLAEMKSWKEAEEQYKLALEAAPSDVDIHIDYGNFLEEAEKQYKLALKINPNDANIHCDYGNLLAELGRWKEAEEQYKLALEINPDADIYYNYGVRLAKMKRWKEAEEQYKLVLKINPNDADIHYNYGVLLAEVKRWKEAEEQYKLALKTDPKHVNTYNNYGTFLEENGRWEEAEEQYKLALKIITHNADIYYNYGNLLVQMGRWKEAEEQYKLALKINPNDAEIHWNYGNMLAEIAPRLEDAKEQYKLALEINPNNIATYYNYGILLTETERRELYNQALEIKPDNIKNLIYKAFIQENLGRIEEAAKIFDDVTSREKDKVENKVMIEIANFKKNALKEKDMDKKVDVLNSVINAFLLKKEFLFKGINSNESRFKNFIDSERTIPKGFPSFLYVLRKWNSYTPILPSNNSSKGGGYFLYHCGKGIVIDPGFNYIENFYKEGFRVADIDAVLITHAHNDHTIDLESILTLVYRHNRPIEETVRKEMEGKKEDEIREEIKRRSKRIDLFMNVGTFMKYSGWLKIKDSNEINEVTVLMPNKKYKLPKEYNGITVYTTKAKHDEIISNQYSIGFILGQCAKSSVNSKSNFCLLNKIQLSC